MRIAGIVNDSIVDGPGIRIVVFTQGCKHSCPGCQNPDTHDMRGGHEESIDNIINIMDSNPLISGLTLSGGDPFEQAAECFQLIQKTKLKHPNYDIWTYTGYTYEQILNSGNFDWMHLLENTDVLVDGPFIQEEKSYDLKFRGSRNQRLIDVKKSLNSNSVVLYHQDDSILDKFQVPK